MNQTLLEQDQSQRVEALDPQRSFIVQAPAGSGKTELLIQRFLTLLRLVNKPEEILAITFTRKAANEMRARVIKALKQAQFEGEPSSAHAKQTWQLAREVLSRDEKLQWQLLNNPNQLRIQTIDSLCANLTRQLPLLSHFGSQPRLALMPAGLYRDAVQEVLGHVEASYEWSQAISSLLMHLDNDFNKLHDLLVRLLAKRDQWLPYLSFDERNNSAIRAVLEQHLGWTITDSLTTLVERFPNRHWPELLALGRFAADQIRLTDPDSPIHACLDKTLMPGTAPEDMPHWLGISKLLLTEDGTWRKQLTIKQGFPAPSSVKDKAQKSLYEDYKSRGLALIATLSEYENVRHSLAQLTSLPQAQYSAGQWDILQSLLFVLKMITAQLRLTFQQQGQIDFIENAQAAILALGSDEQPTDLALSLDYQIKHILVDEFQDTSSTQYQLLEKLTTGWESNDGRTLFVVGDPMQSIYRFREAEVGLFIRMRQQGLGQINLIPITLAVNFRSAPAIVNWNNTQFTRLFPSFEDIATGAVSYSASMAHQAKEDEHADITLRGFIAEHQSTEIKAITDYIHATKQHHPQENIAILVRSRPHLHAIIPALKKAGIPYRAIDIDPLTSRQVIQDLISLTRALLQPVDRIAWLAILRAPWCGLSLADLLAITRQQPKAAILSLLNDQTAVSPDGKARLARVLPILRTKIAERERQPLREWVESTWYALGGPACLPHENDKQDVETFFKLLDQLQQETPVINIDYLNEKLEKLYASAQDDDPATLQIMTIYAAKGLEFDTVILPHLERGIPADDKPLLTWMEQPLSQNKMALLLAPLHGTGEDHDPLYRYIDTQLKMKSNYEIDRLLYVATTRAKKRLYLSFTVEQEDAMLRSAGSFLKKLWPCLNAEEKQCLQQEKHVTDTNDSTFIARPIQRLVNNWQHPLPSITTTSTTYHQQQNGFALVDLQPKRIGIVLHRLFQLLADRGTTWWTQQSTEQHQTYLTQQLRQQGIAPHQLPVAVQQAYRSISQMLNDTRGQWILKRHTNAQTEWSISAYLSNQTENLVIDRTFIDEQGTRWIIDYKTTAFHHNDLEHFLKTEQEKYLKKMQSYATALRLLKPEPIKLGLYFPALAAWHEWE